MSKFIEVSRYHIFYGKMMETRKIILNTDFIVSVEDTENNTKICFDDECFNVIESCKEIKAMLGINKNKLNWRDASKELPESTSNENKYLCLHQRTDGRITFTIARFKENNFFIIDDIYGQTNIDVHYWLSLNEIQLPGEWL